MVYYHITTADRIPQIESRGLGGGSATFTNHRDYSKGRTFLCDREGVRFWHSEVGDHVERGHETRDIKKKGIVPIVLKIDLPKARLKPDERGSADSGSEAWIYDKQILPDSISVWTGSEWLPLSDWNIDLNPYVWFEFDDADGGYWMGHFTLPDGY